MARKKLRVRGDSADRPPGGILLPKRPEEEEAGAHGFSLSFVAGRGVLRMADVSLSNAVTVDLLELIIPGLAFPFDITGGIWGLRHRRHVLGRMRVTVQIDILEHNIQQRTAESDWLEFESLSFEKDHIAVLAECGPKNSRVPLTFRIVPTLVDDRLMAIIDTPRAYGPLPINLLQAASSSIKEMIGIRSEGLELRIPDPVRAVLFGLLPTRGWRLPDYSQARLRELSMLPDRLVLDYCHPDLADETIGSPFGDAAVEMATVRKQEENRIVRRGDVMLTSGEMDTARAFYARLLDRDPNSPFVAARLAMVDVVGTDLRVTAIGLASEAAERHPGRTDLLAVLAHGAALSGEDATEARLLSQISEASNSLEKLAAGLRCGELLLETDPEQAVVALEGALASRREDKKALMALIEAHAKVGNRKRVHRLIPRWIAAHKEATERADAHIDIGRLLMRSLEEPSEAARHFERASLADPTNQEAIWGLAEALTGTGEIQRAITLFERLVRKQKEKVELAGAARALARIGDIWAERQELSLAVQRYMESLELAPDHAPRRARLAVALMKSDRPADAAEQLEESLRRAGMNYDEDWWCESATRLADIYLDALDDPVAAERWLRAIMDREQFPQRDHIRESLRRALEKQGRLDELAADLESELYGSPSYENIIKLIEVRKNAGDLEGALKVIEEGMQRFPDYAELADSFIDICRQLGDYKRLVVALSRRIESTPSQRRRATMALETGKIYLDKLDNVSAAIYWLKSAAEEDESFEEAKKGLEEAFGALMNEAHTLRAERETEAARTLFATIHMESSPPVNYAAAVGEAECALEEAQYESALRAALIAAEGSTELRVRALSAGAKALCELDRPAEAVGLLERFAESSEPADAATLIILAQKISFNDFNDVERVRFILEQAHADAPEREDVDLAIINLLESMHEELELAEYLSRDNNGEIKPGRARRAAEIFHAYDMHERAAAIQQQVFGTTHDFDDVFNLARSLKETGDWQTLLKLFEEYSGNNSNVDELLQQELVSFADRLETAGEIESACLVMENLARRSDPDGSRAATAARLALTLNDRERARGQYRLAIENNPQTKWIVNLVQLLNPEDDRDEISRLLKLLSGKETLLNKEERLIILDAQAKADIFAGNDEAAIPKLAMIIELNPSDQESLNRLIAIMGKRGQWESLVGYLRKRIDRLEDPTELAEAEVGLGLLLEDMLGDEIGAEASFEHALEVSPDHQAALRARASLAYKRRKWNLLNDLLGRIDPKIDDKELAEWRKASAEHLGRRDAKLEEYQKSIAGESMMPGGLTGLGESDQDPDFEGKLAEAFEQLRRK